MYARNQLNYSNKIKMENLSKKWEYLTPELEILSISIESGFATSGGDWGIDDLNGNDGGSWD